MAEHGPATTSGIVDTAEHTRVVNDYALLADQFAAVNEVLSALGRSAGDPDTVLTTVVESARQLCRGEASVLYVLENGIFVPIKAVGVSEVAIRHMADHPMPLDRDTLIGRVALDRDAQQISDVLDDAEYGRYDLQRLAGYRSVTAAPMLVDNRVIGALNLWRYEVSPFDQREMSIVSAFAAQAAMAVNTIQLVQQLEARGAELAQKVDELEALREVGEAVNSSLNVDNVLATIGYEVCRRIREQADTAYLPVVMVTASGDEEKVKAPEAGADDFLTKPVNRNELLARKASLTRIKRYQDTIERQAQELAMWNRELTSRVDAQVDQLERMSRLRRFLSPQLAELVVDSGDETFLESHRREIVVVFCDLRGFTTFAEASEPEEVINVLGEYHQALGDLIFRFEGTLERFAGDGLMVFFNDPVRCEDGPLRAIRMALAMRTRIRGLAEVWTRQGHDLAMGIGIAQGYATLGKIGFEGRFDYAAIGSVTNLASRLCDVADPWQILVAERVFSAAGSLVVGEDVGSRDLRGFSRSVRAYSIRGVDNSRVPS